MKEEKILNGMKILSRLANLKGIDIFMGTVKGRQPRYLQFRLLLFMMSQEIGKELSRADIIMNIYKPNVQLKERSLDPHISMLNKILRETKFGYLIRNDGNPKNPKGFYLAKVN
ncbi:helix-turn-helix domain-containing protein [candidate division KSB1 bacterium]|nr:helix-turn-helix domain-containing protein [candidate division KSB1 bacterium]